ncbi:MAG: MotA/TolQ/ExbB proton channel family protein [Bacteroidota bacterium]|nr:MotA/TolQ/ExbB proton channel family protein [Bacteroidota bacterium]MDP4196443.1 MotA/TolQ/ExbB proton channel family protein [Bacteroidota bacterium]
MNASKIKSAFTGFAGIAIPVLITVAILIYIFVLGNPENFQGKNPANHPLPGNYLGIVYKGGIIVPILMSLLMMVLTFAIERFITISKAKGKGRVNAFVARVHTKLSQEDLDTAIAECDKQRGSVANVIKAGILKYKEMIPEKSLNRDQKVVAIKQEIEEATSLELPMLEQNLVIVATIASIATLMGLLGTVLGMIKAFSALATAGAPDAVALANGISEALINTALGIGTSALSIIAYNYFTTKIDKLTYSIDEAGVAIIQNFTAHHN